MKMRYLFGTSGLIYLFALACALLQWGLIANIIAAFDAAACVIYLHYVAQALLERYNKDRKTVIRVVLVSYVVLSLVVVVHVLALFAPSPQQAAIAFVPAIGVFMVAIIALNSTIGEH